MFKPQMADYKNGLKTIVYYENEVFKPFPKDPRFLVSDRGAVYDTKDQVLLSPYIANVLNSNNPKSYMRYFLPGHYGSIDAHRLVMETFCPAPPMIYNLKIRHIDGNNMNNRWSLNPLENNLEWVTQSQIIRSNYSSGLVDPASRGYIKYTAEDIHQICKLLEKGFKARQIAEILGFSGFGFYRLIRDLRNGKAWVSITSQYNIPRLTQHNDEEVIMICELLMLALSDEEVSQRMLECGVDAKISFIRSIRYGNIHWQHIIKNYKFPDRTPRPYSEEMAERGCQLMTEGKSYQEIAKILGVPYTNKLRMFLSQMRNGRTYTSIAGKYDLKPNPKQMMTKDTAQQICELIAQDKNSREIANALNIVYTQSFKSIVNQIRRGLIHKDVSERYKFPRARNKTQKQEEQ